MKNKFWGNDTIIALLCSALIILSFFTLIADFRIFVLALVMMLFISIMLIINIKGLRRIISSVFLGKNDISDAQKISFENLDVPVTVLSKDIVVWYNTAFKDVFLQGEDMYLFPITRFVKEYKNDTSSTGQNIHIDNDEYTVYSSNGSEKNQLTVCYFVNDTQLKYKAREYDLTRPVVMHIVVDTYDDVLKELKESVRARIMSKLDKIVEDLSTSAQGVAIKTGVSRYQVIIEDRHYDRLHNGKFEILSKARAIQGGHVTLSIGIGRTGKDLAENDILSRQALDMALGRGGDQAVVKELTGYEFFGGVLPSVEKRSRVRSRIIANALKDVIMQSENVIIMGHKMSDLDAVGSAVGMYCAVTSLEKEAHIIVDENKTLAKNLITWVKEDANNREMFIPPEKANDYVDEDTLLIIVDTHVARMTECEALCEKCKRVVVIDHHRRMVDFIKDTVVTYHEAYASSASELVTELMQYIFPATYKIPDIAAAALLSGIMLDTRYFAEKSGVRTFEAAAYLRRQGAQTNDVLRLFSVPKELYTAKSKLVNDAIIYKGVAVALSEDLDSEMLLAVPQAANDLLTIDGIGASVVAVKFDNKINVSARSMGEINVQVLMEYVGGGGHLTMAGAQFKNMTLDEVKEKIKESIDNYKG